MMQKADAIKALNDVSAKIVAERKAHADALAAMKTDYDSQLATLSGAIAASNLAIDAKQTQVDQLTVQVKTLTDQHNVVADQVPDEVEAGIASLLAFASNPA